MPPLYPQNAALKLALILAGVFYLSADPRPTPHQMPPATEWSRWIEAVRQRALEYSDTLPDFICSQKTRRYVGDSETSTWQAQDVLEAELSYNQKNEHYSHIRLNGKASRRPLESLGGALSIGEFGSLLRTLFLPDTHAEFWKEGEEQVQGRPAVIARFKVSKEHSGWTLSFKNSHSLRVAYQGRVWVDAANHQVLRITQESLNLPPTFPIAHSETTTMYSYVSVPGLEGKTFLLPQTAHTTLHERQPPTRSLNVIDFRNYRKFTADVRLVPE